MNKQVIVKGLFGSYDRWADPRVVEADTDYILFTDQDVDSKVFEVRKMKREPKLERMVKIQPWEYIGFNYERYIWMDANIHPRRTIGYPTGYDIVCLEHPFRNCVYQEYQACLKLGKADPNVMWEQVKGYRDEGYPENNGMVQTGLLIRQMSESVVEHAELWVTEVLKKSRRDQLSFNYALWQMQAPPTVKVMDWEKFKGGFKLIPHK